MADAGCAVQGFSRPSEASDREIMDDSFPGLNGSVTFGRFVSESLDWGRWSSFRQNKYLEEAAKFSKPGSVANMKAHFEAHFKRIAAMRAAAKAEEENIRLASESVVPERCMASFVEESPPKKMPPEEESQESQKSEEKEQMFNGFVGNNDNQVANVDEDDDDCTLRSSEPPQEKSDVSQQISQELHKSGEEEEAENVDVDDCSRRSSSRSTQKSLQENSEANPKISHEEKQSSGFSNENGADDDDCRQGSSSSSNEKPIQESSAENQQFSSLTINEKKPGSRFSNENQGPNVDDDCSWRSISRQNQKPLQENSSANQLISSTFKEKKCGVFGRFSFSSPTTANPGKKETPPKASKRSISRFTQSMFETPPSSSKSTLALRNIAMPNSLDPKTPSPSEWKRKITPSHSGSKKTNVMSQSVSTSCWKSSSSVWKRPVQAVCSPFRFRSEERAEKRKEFYLKVEEKLKSEKLAHEANAKNKNRRNCAKILVLRRSECQGSTREVLPQKKILRRHFCPVRNPQFMK
ncbi:uncharacterized protein LOC144716101 isoform X2 [Wolffia australiana]